MNNLKIGDTVEVISLNKLPNEDWNYITLEDKEVKIGYRFKVSGFPPTKEGGFIALEGLNYYHPREKFKKVPF